MEFFSFVIPLVCTGRLLRSVFTNVMTERIFRIKKKRQFTNMKVFVGDFTNRITKGFKMAALYDDVTNSPFELPM